MHAAAVAPVMQRGLTGMGIGLLVGAGGGVPSAVDDIWLGDGNTGSNV